MKKISIGIFLVILYCFPFVYFSMKQDFANRSMIGYLIMIVATSLLAFLVKYFCNFIPFIIGNMLSMMVSFYFNGGMSDTEMWDGGYFKPFSSSQLIIVVSLLNLIPQYIAMILAKKVHNINKF
ncbi:hypothetical protein SAMN05444673_2875 [Bacillus sp. OV166]|uniref:hypothetical protein n=1 Tax=Bacillus sp. OV166 TaxID=1882763 RepID=UPI000A2AD4E5|nr:hypothetical protein [Bacillus sp. OV166]SMQ77509.1 hypothetical protein SAMN05444673_2838 [Bacillus sp. OV166]SMQ77541.1 hypothetical protein SAMN05444673_2875 [Bacillus sp. OV166]